MEILLQESVLKSSGTTNEKIEQFDQINDEQEYISEPEVIA